MSPGNKGQFLKGGRGKKELKNHWLRKYLKYVCWIVSSHSRQSGFGQAPTNNYQLGGGL